MLTHFICPDGRRVKIEDCLKECRFKDGNGLRCMDKALLLLIANGRREWTGKPSCTQITQNMREQYLRVRFHYAVEPSEHLFMLYGTMLHANLEREDDELLIELPLENEYVTGRLDTYNKNECAISDHKYISQWGVRDFIGHKQKHYIMQLNIYKRLFEAQYPEYPVNKLVSNLYIRDWNKRCAAKDGIQRCYRIPQPILDADVVDSFIKERSLMLKHSIEEDKIPEVCPADERCFGNGKADQKCISYCSVNNWCPYYIENYGNNGR